MGMTAVCWHGAGKTGYPSSIVCKHITLMHPPTFSGQPKTPSRRFLSRSDMLNWTITLLLLAMVAGFFVLAGTGGAIGSLLAHITVVGCSAVAVVMLVLQIWHRSRHS
jgi:hypothetical protein